MFSGDRLNGFHQILPKIHEERSLRTTALNYEKLEETGYVLFIFVFLIVTDIISYSNWVLNNAWRMQWSRIPAVCQTPHVRGLEAFSLPQ